MEMPEKIYAIKTHKYGGIFNIDKLKTLSCQPDGAYYHENILKAKDAEIAELKAQLKLADTALNAADAIIPYMGQLNNMARIEIEKYQSAREHDTP